MSVGGKNDSCISENPCVICSVTDSRQVREKIQHNVQGRFAETVLSTQLLAEAVLF